MAPKVRGQKTRQVAVRFSQRQVGKLEELAVIRDGTVSDVIRELVDNFGVDYPLPKTFQIQRENNQGSQAQQNAAA
jgi:hypothetical protein